MTKIGNGIHITDEESKTCVFDNKKFNSSKEMIWYVRKTYELNFEEYIIIAYYNGIWPVCLKTGNRLSFKASKLGPFFHNYSKNNFPRKPMTDDVKKKIKIGCEKTFIEKFGVKNIFSTDWCKDKIKTTLLSRYGVDNIMKLEEMKSLFSASTRTPESFIKAEITSMDRYGVLHYSVGAAHRLNIRKKGFKRLFGNWDVYQGKLSNNSQSKIICLGSIADIDVGSPLKFKCNICGFEWNESFLLMPTCGECDKNYINARSKEESMLMSWLKSENINFDSNIRFTTDNGKIYDFDNPPFSSSMKLLTDGMTIMFITKKRVYSVNMKQ